MPKTTNQKEQIVKAALKLFATQGYGSASVRQIAKAAKVSPSLMYNYFSSKDEVLKEIVLRGFSDIKASLASYKADISTEKAIEVHVITTFQIIKQNSQFWRLLHTIRLQDKVLHASKKLFDEMIRVVTSTFVPVFKKLGYPKPELEAILFLAQIDGLALLYLQNPSIDIKNLSHQLIQRYKK
jgi:AcrR family transcriptional regulator